MTARHLTRPHPRPFSPLHHPLERPAGDTPASLPAVTSHDTQSNHAAGRVPFHPFGPVLKSGKKAKLGQV
ncbi:hypothetical protein GA0115251_12723 [Streptomyces sp. TverLS-915]|nr:hypothetical protein GA0115251_12723 [Streptomyces sp. TverLS-915]